MFDGPGDFDWKRGLGHDEIIQISKEQANMPVEISPRLYLSNRIGAHNIERLKELEITHVLNVAGPSAQLEAQIYKTVGISSLNLDAEDEEVPNAVQTFASL